MTVEESVVTDRWNKILERDTRDLIKGRLYFGLVSLRRLAAAVLSSYGWSGDAGSALQGILEEMKIEMLGVVEVKGPSKKAECDKLLKLADGIGKAQAGLTQIG